MENSESGSFLNERIGAEQGDPQKFSVSYTADDIKRTYKIVNRRYMMNVVFLDAIGFIMLAQTVFFKDNEKMLYSSIVLAFVCFLYVIKILFYYSKSKKTAIEKTVCNTYMYTVYDDRINIEVFKKDEFKGLTVIRPCDISASWEDGTYIVFQHTAGLYIIPKNTVPMYGSVKNFLENNNIIANKNIRKGNISVLLSLLSVLSVVTSSCLVNMILSGSGSISEYSWIFFLFLPIPIIALIYGIALQRKMIKNSINISIAVITSAALLCSGLCGYIFSSSGLTEHPENDGVSHDPSVISYYEDLSGMEIPYSENISAYDYSECEQYKDEFSVSGACIFYKDEEFAKILSDVQKDTRWLRDVPTALTGCFSFDCSPKYYDYCVLYNIDEKTYNVFPESDGTCRFVCIGIDIEESMIYIEEYLKTVRMFPEDASYITTV